MVDLTKICTDLICTAFEDSSSQFNGTPRSVLGMLSDSSAHSNLGGTIWSYGSKFNEELAKDAFDALNNSKVFAP
ncbi:MAG TPA: hypothetical protein VLA49_13850 [Anaerolineales bacterium]|nr:hypothetical protein [Anaerolineales bacterium]